MLKLTTDKHEASHGLSATAELLVQYQTRWQYSDGNLTGASNARDYEKNHIFDQYLALCRK